MQYYTIPLRILFVLAVMLILSCKSTQVIDNKSINVQYTDSICFVVFNINKDSILEKRNIKLIGKTKTAGIIKEDIQENINSENYLTIEVFEQEKLVNIITINHPLYKNIEYIDENNEFKSKYIELDKNDFFIRLQQKSASTQIRISESLKNKKIQELITIKL